MRVHFAVLALFMLMMFVPANPAVWEEITSDLTAITTLSTNYCQLLFSTADTGWVHCGVQIDSQCVYRTVNGGANWTLLRIGCTNPGYQFNPRSISFADNRNGWILDNDSLLHTVDGGVTWSALPMTVKGACLISFKSATHGFAFTDTAFYSTADGGVSWQEHTLSSTGKYALYDMFFIDTLRGWVVTQEGMNPGKIFRTVDGGETWAGIMSLGYYRSIWVVDTIHIALAGDIGGISGKPEVRVSHNGGTTWKSFNPEMILSCVAFFTPDYGVVTTSSDSVFLETGDGGSTWNPIANVKGKGSTSMSVRDDFMYMMTDDGRIYRCALSTSNSREAGGPGREAFRTVRQPIKEMRFGSAGNDGGRGRRILLSGSVKKAGTCASGLTVRDRLRR